MCATFWGSKGHGLGRTVICMLCAPHVLANSAPECDVARRLLEQGRGGQCYVCYGSGRTGLCDLCFKVARVMVKGD